MLTICHILVWVNEVTVTATDGTAIAMRLTDRSGKIEPIRITVPEDKKNELIENNVKNIENKNERIEILKTFKSKTEKEWKVIETILNELQANLKPKNENQE